MLAQIDFEPIKAGQETLARVFKDYAFAIPNYQRPYAWEVEHAQALLSDIMETLDEALSAPKDAITYFLGSITRFGTSSGSGRSDKKRSLAMAED